LILVGRHLDAVARLTELVNQVISICVEELSISGRSQERGFRTISERFQLGKQRRDSLPQDGARGPVGVPLLHILIELTGGVVLLLECERKLRETKPVLVVPINQFIDETNDPFAMTVGSTKRSTR